MKNKFHLSITALVCITTIFFNSCASIVSKSAYPVSITTNPVGANISIINRKGVEIYKGASPATVTMKSGSSFFKREMYQVKITATGYAEQIIPVTFSVNGWYFGNLLLGGVIGMLIIDPATGAMYKLETPPINVTLSKLTASIEVPSLQIVDLKDLPKEMVAKLIRIK